MANISEGLLEGGSKSGTFWRSEGKPDVPTTLIDILYVFVAHGSFVPTSPESWAVIPPESPLPLPLPLPRPRLGPPLSLGP